MMHKLRNWLKNRSSATEEPQPVNVRRTGAGSIARAKDTPGQPQKAVDAPEPGNDEELQIESAGPGKNVLIRNKYIREETGTHEKLKILDDSLLDSGEETGIDPYNTGGFDRSKNWSNRFRK